MAVNHQQKEKAQEEIRNTYATWMARFSYTGLAGMVVFFILYVAAVIPGKVTPEKIIPLLIEPAPVFIEKTGVKTGWGWVSEIHFGDTLSFAAIALLAGVSILVFFIIIPRFFKMKLHTYGWMAVIQLLVFLLAASGWISGSH